MIHLSEQQENKLQKLERDPAAKVLGAYGDCPVLTHSGLTTGRAINSYGRRIALLREDGRLAGMGIKQQEFFFRTKK